MKIFSVLPNGSNEQERLINLYNHLLDHLKDSEICDIYVHHIVRENILMSSDECVHILNVFSPIKQKLSNWNYFVSHCEKVMLQNIGPKRTSKLIKIFN